jgi:hypothetical protein
LKSFTEFPDILHDKIQLQRFLGSLNYIRSFYKGKADDILILQQRLKKNHPAWNDAMTKSFRRIKDKVQTLPPLSLPTGEGNYIIETNASNSTWAGVLIEKINGVETICSYASGSFRGA